MVKHPATFNLRNCVSRKQHFPNDWQICSTNTAVYPVNNFVVMFIYCKLSCMPPLHTRDGLSKLVYFTDDNMNLLVSIVHWWRIVLVIFYSSKSCSRYEITWIFVYFDLPISNWGASAQYASALCVDSHQTVASLTMESSATKWT